MTRTKSDRWERILSKPFCMQFCSYDIWFSREFACLGKPWRSIRPPRQAAPRTEELLLRQLTRFGRKTIYTKLRFSKRARGLVILSTDTGATTGEIREEYFDLVQSKWRKIQWAMSRGIATKKPIPVMALHEKWDTPFDNGLVALIGQFKKY